MAVVVLLMPQFNFGLNIDIYPTPADTNSIEGLCGNRNGLADDDFRVRGASATGNIRTFSLSWG